jgi:SpoIID/LytB domain protein
VVIEGKGWGHGVGMAQDGAFAMGAAGAGTSDILNHFYPGTSLGSASGHVRVEVLGTAPGAVVAFPGGGEVRDAESGAQSPGFPITVSPGGSVELKFAGGAYRARPLSGAKLGPMPPGTAAAPAAAPPGAPPPEAPPATTTTVPNILGIPLGPTPPPTAAPPAAPAPAPGAPAAPDPPAPGEAASGRGLVAVPQGESTVALPARDRRYRGILRAAGAAGGLRLLNELDVEQYLKGMGEVRDPGWPAASLRAQAIAARTYALRTMTGGGEICDTQQCQVYLGQQVEYPAMNKAVADSRGQVLRHGGSFALTVYSANGGGVSATPEEGWGGDSGGAYPYLRSAPYRTTNPDPWTIRQSLTELAGRFGHRGEAATIRVSRTGPSGRAMEVLIEGPSGATPVEGRRFASELSLRSNFFTLRVEAPPPPPEAANEVAAGTFDATPTANPGGAPALSRLDDDALGRLPLIALALLLLVAVNGARQALTAKGRLARVGPVGVDSPVGVPVGPAVDPPAQDGLALPGSDLEEPGAADESASGRTPPIG